MTMRVELGMTYGNPSIAAALESLARQGMDRLLVLPLYPQYCSSTTGSVFDRASRALQRRRWLPETRFVNDYYHDAGYLDALAAKIRRHWEEAGERSHLLFSYHGIPAAYVAAGDPYQAQSEATTRLLVSRLGLAPGTWTHCYQSRFGRVEWLQPYTEDTLKTLAKSGVRSLSVVSPSFAVDCLETLEEIAIEYRDKFLELGGERLTLVPALNDDDRHAEVLAAIVKNQLQGLDNGRYSMNFSSAHPWVLACAFDDDDRLAGGRDGRHQPLQAEILLDNLRVLVQKFIVQPGQSTVQRSAGEQLLGVRERRRADLARRTVDGCGATGG